MKMESLFLVEEYFKSPDKIYEYIRETGLEKVFMTKEIKKILLIMYLVLRLD